MQKMDVEASFLHAHLLLEEGRAEDALAVLDAINAENERQLEISYLQGWCYIQLKQWDDVGRLLSPLAKHIEDLSEVDQHLLTERELVSFHIFQLGLVAILLQNYEEALSHFTWCLKVLHDRRVHLPIVRIKVRYALGSMCIAKGLYKIAIQHYEDALRLCEHYGREKEVAHIYYGLSDAYRFDGDLANAHIAGQHALQLYREQGEKKLEARVLNLLGRIYTLLGDMPAAIEHYTQSLAVDDTSMTLVMLNYAALAELSLKEGRLGDAREYRQRAISYLRQSDNVRMKGAACLIIGKVTMEEAQHAEGATRHQVLEEAISWFEQAQGQLHDAKAYADLAEAYGKQAEALEKLGRVQEAVTCWNSAYEVLSRPQDVQAQKV